MATAPTTWTAGATHSATTHLASSQPHAAGSPPGEPGDRGRLVDQLQSLEQQLGEREALGPVKLRDWIDLAEAWHITRVLDGCRGNRTAAARELGIGRRTLYAKMEKLGIAPRWTIDGGR